MAVKETLDDIENLVVGASHVPLTGKAMINENDLVHLVEILRQDLPKELDAAKSVMRERDALLAEAQQKAGEIIEKAHEEASRLLDEQEIVAQAREKARLIVEQAQEHERKLRADADQYAAQVFDQLIAHVSNTFQGVRQAQQGLESARNVLVTAKDQMAQKQMLD